MEGYITPPSVGPGRIGQLAAIAAGYYTKIVKIITLSEAAAGEPVPVEVWVRNLHTTRIYIATTGRYNGVDLLFSPDYANVDAGATYSFTTSFTMPNKDITIDVWSWYWTGTEWVQDDHSSVDIALAEVVEPYKGTISRMELEYNESRANIPAYDVPQGERGLVHIWGRNDMSTNQKLGIYWIVKDPDGITVEEYFDWQTFSTSPDDTHEFIGDRFTLDKPGIYGIQVGLLMNPDAPFYVDIYYGNLCTVAAVPEPEFAGTIITKELEYDETRGAIPVY